MIYFTADTHFGHAKIIEYCKRPFNNVHEMDHELIKRWNERVKPDDSVFHLGDFCWGNADTATQYLSQLNGRVHLIYGNHDGISLRNHNGFGIRGQIVDMMLGGKLVILCHYALRVWDRSHRGSLHLFGHTHGNLVGDSQSCDVGVDAWDYRPVTLEEAIERMQTYPKHVDAGP